MLWKPAIGFTGLLILGTLLTLQFISSCGGDESGNRDTETDTESETDTDTETDTIPDEYEVFDDPEVEIIDNPYGKMTLVAVLKVSHEELLPDEVVEIHVHLKGFDDTRPPFSEVLYPGSSEYQTNFDMSDILEPNQVGIPVLGLYPEEENIFSFGIFTETQAFVGEVKINTGSVPDKWTGKMNIEVHDEEAITPGWTSLDSSVFDHFGNGRWFGRQIHKVLSNGNFLDTTRIDERNFLGKLVVDRMSKLPGHLETHHDGVELQSGNIVACVSNSETVIINSDGDEVASNQDYIVEFDHPTGDIVNAWDLRAFLDVDRTTLSVQYKDWLHMNTLCYDEFDDTIIMSGRHQAIAKLTRSGIQGSEPNKEKELVWIFSPHLDWGMAGWDGQGKLDPNDYLLTAVDSNGIPYGEEVQQNLAPPGADLDDFHWPIGQHGLRITSREKGKLSLLIFNNQASVIFDGPGSSNNQLHGDFGNDRSTEPYSLMVEYEIDEVQKTVRQKWSYGKEMPEYYCSLKSGVQYFTSTQNSVMGSCGGNALDLPNNPYSPHIVERTPQGDIAFELVMQPTGASLYQVNRVNLYHPEKSAKH